MSYVAREYAAPLGWCVEYVTEAVGKTIHTGLDQRDAESLAAALNGEECCAPDDCGGYCRS